MRQRIIVGAIARNFENKILLLKMPINFGAYPGQWGLVGGGVELGEEPTKALVREMREETGLVISQLSPFTFIDGVVRKKLLDGTIEEQQLFSLVYDCVVQETDKLTLNHEWEKAEWVATDTLQTYNLNSPTREVFRRKGWLD